MLEKACCHPHSDIRGLAPDDRSWPVAAVADRSIAASRLYQKAVISFWKRPSAHETTCPELRGRVSFNQGVEAHRKCHAQSNSEEHAQQNSDPISVLLLHHYIACVVLLVRFVKSIPITLISST